VFGRLGVVRGPGRSATRASVLFGAAFALAMAPAFAGADIEWRPAISGGYSKVFDSHAAFGAALRIQLARFFFLQPEYLVLAAGDHTDTAPQFCLASRAPHGSRYVHLPALGVAH